MPRPRGVMLISLRKLSMMIMDHDDGGGEITKFGVLYRHSMVSLLCLLI